jgi:flavin reductase (DIM6/NTAB) family NADH-FMN oxidoreductase RutF
MDTGEHTAPEVDVTQFKAAFGCFATGVTVATTESIYGPHGATANAVMSVSLEPLLVLVSIQTGSRMDSAMKHSDNFALSILSDMQREIADYFADSSRPHDRRAFELFPHYRAKTGAPLLKGALAYVDCRTVDIHPAGDHTLFIGRALYVESAEAGRPLLYFRGDIS